MDWAEGASCRGADPELFFARALSEARPALKLCDRCPVKEPCLSYALEQGIDHGVWGGLTERQRRAVVRRRALPYAV
ncbi:WhiB family transcriptional regulator [Nitriliruptoraceae bacterium ZYF776]|nr:WhiB family transcriptional regulator [Profundirhabdus halotolerans]